MAGPMDQPAASPVFAVRDERAVTEQSALRTIAFLRAELELLPEWHPLFQETTVQLAHLQCWLPTGPRGIA